VCVTGAEEELVPYIKASEHIRAAITILDMAGAPADVAAHLDLAAERLVQLAGVHWTSTDPANDDPNPEIMRSG
jgi:hypothetical protein